MGLTHYTANRFLELISARVQNLASGSLYVGLGLATSVPAADGTGAVEPSTGNYKRVCLGIPGQAGTWKMSSASNGTAQSSEQIAFNKATASWGTCRYILLFDAATGGHLLWFGQLTSDISPATGEIAAIDATELSLSIS